MDNNVSKNTFFDKFFKLRFTEEKSTISIKNLLKRDLLQSIDVYRQQKNLNLDLEFIYTILERKIILLHSSQRKLSSKNKSHQVLSKLQLAPIVYSCSIAFSLTRYSSLSSQIIAKNLVSLLALNENHTTSESNLQLLIEIAEPGWINFYLDSTTIAKWLEKLPSLLKTLSAKDYSGAATWMMDNKLPQNAPNYFPLQYTHARYCSLLCLGAREKLITLQNDNFHKVVWHLEQPKSISWLDKAGNLWLTHATEYDLLRQILVVADSFAGEITNWYKLAFNLSEAMSMFEAECRFLGDIKRSMPQKAIARLGLIALAQYWLQRILVEKLNIAAPAEL